MLEELGDGEARGVVQQAAHETKDGLREAEVVFRVELEARVDKDLCEARRVVEQRVVQDRQQRLGATQHESRRRVGTEHGRGAETEG